MRSRPAAVPPEGRPESVFIAYGNVAAAREALRRVSPAKDSRSSRRRVVPLYWRFDQLSAPRLQAMALRDAARADRVVLALGEEGQLDRGTDAWLAALAGQQRGRPIHVVALLGDDAWTISLEETERKARPAESQPARTDFTSATQAAAA